MSESSTINAPKLNLEVYRAISTEELIRLENHYRNNSFFEALPFATNTPFDEIAEHIIPDERGTWTAPVLYYISKHNSLTGTRDLCRKAEEWYRLESVKTHMNILSVSAGMENDNLYLKVLVRVYEDVPNIKNFFSFMGDSLYVEEQVETVETGHIIIPDEILNFKYSEEEIKKHDELVEKQKNVLFNSSKEKPFLNQLKSYEKSKLYNPEDKIDTVYDLKCKDDKLKTKTPIDMFIQVFRHMMTYISGVEYYNYIQVIAGDEEEKNFLEIIENYITDNFIKKKDKKKKTNLYLANEDLPIMMERIYNALFKLYVVQDLIDDPKITDIKITAPDSIRVRIHGKAHMSNVNFVDKADYLRFIDAICIKNGIAQDVPSQTFTDEHDENYILRFTLTADFATSENWPYLHIRKVDRKKPLGDDLIKLGMFDEKIRDYLLDCGRTSRGVVFSGPPGSGKTVCLNWFLEEAYEQSAEILVIQENDELFAYRKGVMFQHPVNYSYRGNAPVSLEDLGRLALVAGANVFIIGEAKGGEICHAITLSNSGCRTAITIHSNSSTETIDKMADLAMKGDSNVTYEQAKRSLKSLQTIVYLKDFKIQEISEITGYDEKTKDMTYRYIYNKNAEEGRKEDYREASNT